MIFRKSTVLLTLILQIYTHQCFAKEIDCYEQFENDSPPFLQFRNDKQQLDNPYFDSHITYSASSLCNKSFVVVWKKNYPKRTYLMGRILSQEMQGITDDFRIVDSNEQHWDYSISPLTGGGFVVTWKTDEDVNGNKISGIKIRARIFNSSGRAITESIDISESPGQHGQPMVAPMPNGGFVVSWNKFGEGICLRVYRANFTPQINEKLVWEENNTSRGLVPYVVTDKDGNISLFMRLFYNLNEIHPFKIATRFNSNGTSISKLYEGDEIKQVPGFDTAVFRLNK